MRSGPTVHQVGPVVAQIERVEERLVRAQARELRPPVVERWAELVIVAIRRRQARAVGEVELVEVSSVPAGEGVVDRGGEGGERVTTGRGEDPSRPRPQALPATLDEIHPDR
jgi:hypothetical protein